MVVRDITNPYSGEIIRGINNYLDNNDLNYNLIITDIKDIFFDGGPFIDTLLKRRVDGIICATENIENKYLDYLDKHNIPIVFIGCYKKDMDFDFSYIATDDFEGGYIMTNYLIELGHKNIGFVNIDFEFSFAVDRFNGFKQSLSNNNININRDFIFNTKNLDIDAGYTIAKKIFNNNNL